MNDIQKNSKNSHDHWDFMHLFQDSNGFIISSTMESVRGLEETIKEILFRLVEDKMTTPVKKEIPLLLNRKLYQFLEEIITEVDNIIKKY